jgi:hypothetical protein
MYVASKRKKMSVAFIYYISRASLGENLGCAEVGKFTLAAITEIHVRSSQAPLETEVDSRDDRRSKRV